MVWCAPGFGGFSKGERCDIMQKWRFEDFENNNRKLKNYLDNVENAIVALCVNDIGAQNYLCGVLQNEFQYSGIDLRKSNISFLIHLHK